MPHTPLRNRAFHNAAYFVTVRHRKLDKGSSNKPLCVNRCAAGEKSCYDR
ncbi:hypothetical protein U3516DRAFT_775413 [Neocallimastix sp. 'constans']